MAFTAAWTSRVCRFLSYDISHRSKLHGNTNTLGETRMAVHIVVLLKPLPKLKRVLNTQQGNHRY